MVGFLSCTLTDSYFPLFKTGAFSKMYALRTLKITAYSNARDFNVPRMLTNNAGLENLYIDVDDSSINLGKEMNGQLPCKLDNITITGRAMRFLSEYLLNVSADLILFKHILLHHIIMHF